MIDQKFPAVPGMVQLAWAAARAGYSIDFLTGRPAAQEAATLGNLTSDGVGVDAGYPSPTTLSDGEDGLFTKPPVANYTDYLKAACAGDPGGSCTTSHYKTATRGGPREAARRMSGQVISMSSTPGSGAGSLGSRRSSASTRISATARFRDQLWSAGTTYHGAHSVDVSRSASS